MICTVTTPALDPTEAIVKRLRSNRRTINEWGTVPRTVLWFGWTVPSSDGTIVKQQEKRRKRG
ncbi:MAG: hypothetical protein PWQ77_2057 [Kosmotogales bacterium]|nr:hypothetical protein [Kosmotogales bacterium]